MPPFIPHKRRRSTSSPTDPPTPKPYKKSKPSLFDTADQPGASATLQDNKAFLDQLNRSESESTLSDVSSDEFEDVVTSPRSKRRKINDDEDEDDQEVDWEDAIQPGETPSTSIGPEPSGDLELTLDNGRQTNLSNSLGKKKGPSKIERHIRIATHCMHVQYLLFHNLVRNGWAYNKEIQSVLVGQLPPNVKKEVDKWRLASGMSIEAPTAVSPPRHKKNGKKAAQNQRNQRDWGKPAERQESGAPNMSRGDPLIRLLKILAAYWKKRWTVTAPGLRKQGYKTLATLEEEITSYKKGKHDAEHYGERVRSVQEFGDLASKCEGSRDIGAQLFVALIRGLGVEARLVASLQPVGFGWSKGEEASNIKRKSPTKEDVDVKEMSSLEEESNSEVEPRKEKLLKAPKKIVRRKPSSKGLKDSPIYLSEVSGDGAVEDMDGDDDDSVVDVTPNTPRTRSNMNYDRDMVFPTFWTECVSPITHEVYPVDPFILNPAVATNAEHLALYESRGAKADKAKQVFAYIVGYNSDGTAKDVTTRYLKRHMWPGRTKGVRLPIEKVPVYNHRGKIKRYEEYDWFKTVMSGYNRTESMRTPVDDLEEAKALKVAKPEKREPKAGEDTLQGYKNSAEFVLERHLRREEAIRPGSKPVKTFTTGKGDKAKEELVFLRKYVEVCRTGESWHKEGRVIKSGETPMKMVPVRAVTLTRKREVEEAERDSGEKLKQGLYSWDQTDWIVPPPIKDGIIPKNAFGNIDCFVPTMVPNGAVHIPLRSTVRICKRLNIDYAEAVTGFEFGNKRAVPVITGVMVAEENENAVMEEWEKDEEERRIKEEGKREKAALATWRKWLMGLRIIQRVREEYGGDADAHVKEDINPFTNQSKAVKLPQIDAEHEPVRYGEAAEGGDDEDGGGGFIAEDDTFGVGFFPEGHEEEEVPRGKPELTIEEEAPVKCVPPPLTNLTDNDPNEASKTFSASECSSLGSPSVVTPIKSTSMSNGTAPKTQPKQKAKSSKTPPSKITATNGTTKKASTSAKGYHQGSPKMTTSSQKIRAAPKRQAARQSETAVKSHYFDHDTEGDETDEESSKYVSASEDELPRKPASRKHAGSASNGRRSLRARKHL